PEDIEIDLEADRIAVAAIVDDDLLAFGARGMCLLAQGAGIGRNLAPAIDAVAVVQDLPFHDDAAAFLCGHVGPGQEDHADADLPIFRAVAGPLHVSAKELVRNLDMNTGAVAGLAVRIDCSAMPDGLQGLDP